MLRHSQMLKSHLIRRNGLVLNRLKFSRSLGSSVREKFLSIKESSNGKIPSNVYSELLNHENIKNGEELEIVDEIINFAKSDSNITSSNKIELHNLILKNLLKFDQSLSMIHQRAIRELNGSVDIDSMVEIIKYNSGRVESSWEIFENYITKINPNAIKNEDLLTSVLTKLVYGDSSEIEDGYQINEHKLLKSIAILQNLEQQPKDLKLQLLQKCLEMEKFDLINIIGIDSLELIHELNPNTSQFVKLWSIWNPETFDKSQIDENLDRINKLVMKLSEEQAFNFELDNESKTQFESISTKFPSLSIKSSTTKSEPQLTNQLFDQLVKILENSKILTNPESRYTPLRLSILKAYGINKLDHKKALYLYHEFISLDKQNVDKIMSTMVIISSYLSISQNDLNQLIIAETLLPQPMTINSLRALILGYSSFDLSKSLEIFNNNIAQSNKTPNDQGVSLAGLLTETLVLANLSQQDREFAYLIHDGAIMNNILETETSKNRIKAIFKRYGEILGEEDDIKIKNLLKQEVLNAIKAL
ncbi:hypothetical protein BN7_2793 [Wickerhamomyces ciferrii]|uniref:Uncharacterized protein n=1 Tax=Wickerhamomyces ciferrii (strain ATCC 14091 / BCRC 22168 / CBS 111 / JCM 3599 / NBRC 0793 / NRRL Y-1031 F-60-10) TaxID=1206466 RepID=K0KJY4_WICCF|nr:uncharacterized protein BN7_2793 [Wickerhamomyces ciferrii]CCH43246.1 hypothetical protein BN7_2793 [Wickerhamomyces ciferrii]